MKTSPEGVQEIPSHVPVSPYKEFAHSLPSLPLILVPEQNLAVLGCALCLQ